MKSNVTWIILDLRLDLFYWLVNLPQLFFWSHFFSIYRIITKCLRGPWLWMMNVFPLHSTCEEIWVKKHSWKCFLISKFDTEWYLSRLFWGYLVAPVLISVSSRILEEITSSTWGPSKVFISISQVPWLAGPPITRVSLVRWRVPFY